MVKLSPLGQGGDILAAREALGEYLRPRSFRRGQLLWSEGDTDGLLVFLKTGRVKIYRLLPTGKAITLYVFGAGSVFGFMPFFDDGPYPAYAQTLEDCQADVISRSGLRQAIHQDPIGDSLDFFAGGDSLELGGATTLSGGGGGTPQCRYWATAQTFYLYDNGVLLCTFDQNDDVEELFVNSPHGSLAEYWKNDDQYLYFFLKDHLGTPRVYMQGPPTDTTVHVGFYANYYPFGELLERGGNIFSDFAFTGKERDIHSSFDYYYFGSRYYDPRIGTFTGVDKAGQFASGYAYGGNNPTMGVDPDGDFFWMAAILGAAFGAYQGVQIADQQNGGLFEKFVYGSLGALVGGYSAGLGAELAASQNALSAMAVSSSVNSYGMFVLSGGQTPFVMNFGLGQIDFSHGSISMVDFGGSPLEIVSDAMGALTFMEGAHQWLTRNDAAIPQDVIDQVKGQHPEWSESEIEARVRSAIKKARRAVDDEFVHVDVETGEVVPGAPHPDVNPRTTYGPHFDVPEHGHVVVHWDAMPGIQTFFKGPAINYLTGTQHAVFETFFGLMPESGPLQQLTLMPAAIYRTYPILEYDSRAVSRY